MANTCNKCFKTFLTSVKIDGRKRNLGNRKYCLDCSPFGQHNTSDLVRKESGLHFCSDCKIDMPRDRFHTKTDGRPYPYCKPCHHHRSKISQQNMKQKCVEYKGGKCELCSYDRYLGALEFHHLDPDKKDFSIADKKRSSFDLCKPELDKCILLCSRCHREVHGGLHEQEINRLKHAAAF